jgi:hypothetical protein
VTGPRIDNRQTEILVAGACLAAGSWLLYDAFDRRGHKRPWWLSFLPGV